MSFDFNLLQNFDFESFSSRFELGLDGDDDKFKLLSDRIAELINGNFDLSLPTNYGEAPSESLEGITTGPAGEQLNLWTKDDWGGYLTDTAVEELDKNGAFDDYLITFGELEAVGDADDIDGLSWLEYTNLFVGPDNHEVSFDLPVQSEAAKTELGKLSTEARQRLEESGRLDDGFVSAEDLFYARDADGNGQVTHQEFEDSRRDIREMHLEDESISDEVVAAYDAIGAYDDNYISDLEQQQAVQYMSQHSPSETA